MSKRNIALFYDYQKPDGNLTIVQLFTIRDKRIHTTVDAGRFA